MTTSPINSLLAGANSSTTQATKSTMGKDDFLKLLVQQLQHQDPMNPMDGSDFAAQLAQFSSVEQLANINSSLTQSLSANQVLSQSINNALSTGVIGKEVRATSNTFTVNAPGSVNLGYTLPSTAASVKISIADASGHVVRTVDGVSLVKGDASIVWDGKNDAGDDVGTGKYTFSIDAKDVNGKALTAASFVEGKVSSVRFRADGTVFVINGVEVPLSKVLEISQE
jgi:flagellar basal-body rod modification protein FlgD